MHLGQLNDAQRRAVAAGEGPILIVAGPGTGKTKTLTARIIHLITTGKAQPSEILALTFTKKAAEEMAARVGLSGPTISTFHALCHTLLGGEEKFVTEAERLQIIRALAKPAVLKGLGTRELGLLISRHKNMADDRPGIKRLTAAYDAALRAAGRRDFDDLLVQTRDVLQQDAAKRADVQQRFRHILVDEFQDTNRLQYELLQLLRGNDNLFVIGDPNQSIYGFRGASGSIFEQFRKDFPHCTEVMLTTNYRSVPEVVSLANSIFQTRTPLEAHTAARGHVQVVQVLNEYSEAGWVLAEIQRAVGGTDMLGAVSDDHRESHRCLKDFAILYRSRSISQAMQRAIDESGLPYQIVGEGSPYEQPQVQTLIELIRGAAADETPQLTGYTDTEVHAVQQLLAADDGVAIPLHLVERLVAILGFTVTPSLRQFMNTLVRFDTVQQAADYFARLAETDFYDPAADAITLLTIHAAKGLEFPYVFLIGAEEGILPHEKADEQEERRLLYVAVTRARESLTLTYGTHRGGKPASMSRFVQATDPAVLPRLIDPGLAADIRRVQKRTAKRSQQSLF